MFGNKVKLAEEELSAIQKRALAGDRIFEKLEESQGPVESNLTEIRQSQEQMGQDVHQVQENIQKAQQYSVQNIEAAAMMIRRMEELIEEMRTAEKEYAQICKLVEQNLEDSQNAVEQNKHFTSPSRYLSELPEEFHKQNASYLEELESMQGLGKQMGILALNAAIEAGRMGSAGMNFVSAVDEVRSYAGEYDKAVESLREKIEEQERKLHAMEDIILQFVNLVKDTNINMTKLMRSVSESTNAIRKSTIRDFSEDVSSVREAVIGVRNLEEEIHKSAERNRMQLEDITVEAKEQKQDCEEVEQLWLSIMQLMEEDKEAKDKKEGE